MRDFFFALHSKTFSENGGMIMKNVTKYKRQYFMPPVKCMKWVSVRLNWHRLFSYAGKEHYEVEVTIKYLKIY